MRALITIITLATTISFCAEPAATIVGDAPMIEVNQLIQTLISQHPWPPNDSVMAEKFLLSAEFIQLKGLCQTNWISVLDNVDSVVGEDVGKTMLFNAFEDLDADSYMTVLEHWAEMFRHNRISKASMIGALYPYGQKRMFLVENYRHTRMQELRKNLKPDLNDYVTVPTLETPITCIVMVTFFFVIVVAVVAWHYFRKRKQK